MSASEDVQDHGAPPPAAADGEPGSRQRWHPTLVLVVVLAAAALWLGATTRDDVDQVAAASDSQDAASDIDSEVDPGILRDAQERWRTQVADGWVRYGLDLAAGVPEELAGSDAWVRVDERGFPVPVPDASGAQRTAVYDAPDGVILGYDYSQIGFVEREVAESGTFDAAAAIIEKYGCDINNDYECLQSWRRDRYGEDAIPG